ncbi:MAG TPA: hypothetical protein VMU26_31075 [Candidatus Polarisedimenticolia bacterium]|nr:hypothetical protein [Candidatus Polarisedimenticolia bacterium]
MKEFRCFLNSAPSSPSPISWRCITSLVLAVLAIFVLGGSMVAQDQDQDQDQNQNEDATAVKTILSFGTMIGDPGTGTPAAKEKNVIRGYVGPASPWLISSVQGSLKSNGALTVSVRGLVLPDGTNPVPFFRAALSCQDPANSTKGELFFTKTFRADAKGNSNIVGTVSLPSHCIAPIILVTSPAVPGNPAGVWFAVTGR